MQLPADLFIESVETKKVYFFSEKSKVGIPNHRHICVTKDYNGDDFIFVCTTTQEATINRFLEKQKIPSSTVVFIPKTHPCFTADTFVNCNSTQPITRQEFMEAYNSGQIQLRGEISDDHYNQIIVGMKESRLVPDEMKEILPDID